MNAKHTGNFFGATIKAETLHTVINIRGNAQHRGYLLEGADTRGANQILNYYRNKAKIHKN